jgi:hypothetical protein
MSPQLLAQNLLIMWTGNRKYPVLPSDRAFAFVRQYKLGPENLAQPLKFFSHSEQGPVKTIWVVQGFLTLCGFTRNYSEDLSGKLSNNSMRPELFWVLRR